MDDDEEDEQPREFARGYPFAVDYFPEALRSQVASLDVERFDALVTALLDDWAASSSSAPAAQVERSLQWVSLVYWCVPLADTRLPASGSVCSRPTPLPAPPRDLGWQSLARIGDMSHMGVRCRRRASAACAACPASLVAELHVLLLPASLTPPRHFKQSPTHAWRLPPRDAGEAGGAPVRGGDRQRRGGPHLWPSPLGGGAHSAAAHPQAPAAPHARLAPAGGCADCHPAAGGRGLPGHCAENGAPGGCAGPRAGRPSLLPARFRGSHLGALPAGAA